MANSEVATSSDNWHNRLWPNTRSGQICLVIGMLIPIGTSIAKWEGWLDFFVSDFFLTSPYGLLFVITLGLLGYSWWNVIVESLRGIKAIGGKVATSLVNWLLGLIVLALIGVQVVVLPWLHDSNLIPTWLYWSPTVAALGLLGYILRDMIFNSINRLTNFVWSFFSIQACIRCLCEKSWRCLWMMIFFIAGLIAAIFLTAKYCFGAQWCALSICGDSYYFDYFLFASLLISVCMVCALMNEIWTYRLRRMDWSEVKALIFDAEYRLAENQSEAKKDPIGTKQINYIEDQIKILKDELQDTSGVYRRRGKSPHTEYDVLTLDQALLSFYSEAELLARSDSLLNNLREYADDVERQYAREKFNRHEDKINHLKNKLESTTQKQEIESPDIRRNAAERLRAYLVELLEHIAVVDRYWFTGQAIARSLVVCSSSALVVLLVMGILPVLDKNIEDLYEAAKANEFGFFNALNYAFLAASGAYAGVLKTMLQAKELDLGEDAGKRAAYRAVIGGAMGLAAGALAYALAASGLLGDDLLNPLLLMEKKEDGSVASIKDFSTTVYAGMIYSFAVGFSFERFYERVKSIGQ